MNTYTGTFTRTATGTAPASISLDPSLTSVPSGVTVSGSSVSILSPVASSQGTTFTFGGVTFGATNIKVKKTGKGYDQDVDVSTLALADGATKVYEPAELYDYGPAGRSVEISLSYLGDDEPNTDDELTLVCEKFGLNDAARCTEFELEAAVGEKIKGTATFVIKG